MLLILIPAVWLAIAVFVVVLCRMAARGDAALSVAAESGTQSHSFPGVILFEDEPRRPARDERIGRRAAGAGSSSGRRARCLTS